MVASNTVAGLSVHGIGGAGPGRFGFAYEWDEEQIAARARPECDLILSHTPPARTTLDLLHDNAARRQRIDPRDRGGATMACSCAATSTKPAVPTIEACLCLNVGGLGAPFGRAQVGFVRRDERGAWECTHEDLESGVVRRWMRT